MRKWSAEYVREKLDVSGCRSLIFLDKVTYRPGEEPVTTTHYYLSSLDPDKVSAEEFQNFILGHWEVENCLHLVKDRDYGEDKHVCGSDWGKIFTVMTNMAVSLVRLMRKGERTLKEIRERFAENPTEPATILGFRKKTC